MTDANLLEVSDPRVLKLLLNGKITMPSGGSAGQVLKKTADGVEWGAGGGGVAPTVEGTKVIFAQGSSAHVEGTKVIF